MLVALENRENTMTIYEQMREFVASVSHEAKTSFGFSLPLSSEADYNKACDLIEELDSKKGTDKEVDFIYHFMKMWEDKNLQALPEARGIDFLLHLMEVNNLSQYDLPEIGKQPYVSRIISGKATLKLHHIDRLSDRFNVPRSMFLDD
ncbi:helix-turn-helix domain-containing protein [Endozoicomonas sp. ALD040]|uniref:helix-turn-helix domain-containing protein n=1 Tax=unclassified Endozoicomonas TaxID=2644528 RepID=UPI003BAF9EC7